MYILSLSALWHKIFSETTLTSLAFMRLRVTLRCYTHVHTYISGPHTARNVSSLLSSPSSFVVFTRIFTDPKLQGEQRAPWCYNASIKVNAVRHIIYKEHCRPSAVENVEQLNVKETIKILR